MRRGNCPIPVGVLLIFVTSAGCASKQGESDTAGTSSTSGETDSSVAATDGGSNTSAPATASDGEPTSGESTSGESTSGEPTSGETTGGEPAGYDEACAEYCEFVAGCVGGTTRGCIEESCQDGIEPGGACEDAWLDAFACFLTLTCAEATADNRCKGQIFAADDLCSESPGTCGEGGFGLGPGACELSEPCPDHARRLFCGDGVCTCFEDDVVVAECADEGVCPDIDKVNAAAMACCGWDLLDGEPG